VFGFVCVTMCRPFSSVCIFALALEKASALATALASVVTNAVVSEGCDLDYANGSSPRLLLLFLRAEDPYRYAKTELMTILMNASASV
jgi:hypothetical protein